MTVSLAAKDFAYELDDNLVLPCLHATPCFRLESPRRSVLVRRLPR